jgi:hypothetical protein
MNGIFFMGTLGMSLMVVSLSAGAGERALIFVSAGMNGVLNLAKYGALAVR